MPILRQTFLMAVAHTPSFFAASFSGRLKCERSLLALSNIGAACACTSVSCPCGRPPNACVSRISYYIPLRIWY